jgi:hypothetical protein
MCDPRHCTTPQFPLTWADIQRERRRGKNSLPISIEVNEIPDPAVGQMIESVVRDGIGQQLGETWKVWIRSLSGAWHITVQGPNHMRERLFFGASHTLPEKIRAWLMLYPFQ